MFLCFWRKLGLDFSLVAKARKSIRLCSLFSLCKNLPGFRLAVFGSFSLQGQGPPDLSHRMSSFSFSDFNLQIYILAALAAKLYTLAAHLKYMI